MQQFGTRIARRAQLQWRQLTVLLTTAAMLPLLLVAVPAQPAHALGTYSNAAIADKALSYVGQKGGNACNDAHKPGDSGGQCRAFVNCIVWMVSDHTQNLGGSDYFAPFLSAGGVEITDSNQLQKGDIVQEGQGIHTFIIVSRVSGNTFNVVDSNHDYKETVLNYNRTVSLSSSERAFRMGTVGGTSSPPSVWQTNQTMPDGTRFTEQNNAQQYISIRGAALPLSVGDAQAFDGEGNNGLAQAVSGYAQAHPSTALPVPTVVRVVGTPSQFLFDGSKLQPIDAPATSSCLLYTYGQATALAVPTMWSSTIAVGPGIACSLPDGTRFTEQGSLQQYVAYGSASLAVSVGDAQAYDAEGNTAVATMASGYVGGHSNAMTETHVVRVVGNLQQYVFDGSVLHPINAFAASSCWLYTTGQMNPFIVPTTWSGNIPVGAELPCALPDGTRFNEQDNLQQYIAWHGASLPLSYGDAQAYDAEHNTAEVVMATGYLATHPAGALPANSIVRPVGAPAQYLFDGSSLHPIGNPTISACLLQQYNQATVFTVPTMWSGEIPVGTSVACPNTGSTSNTTTPPDSTTNTSTNTTTVNRRATNGYRLVAADGGIFSFGSAQFYGSTGGMKLNKPIVGVADTPSGNGYWLVASDGGVFAFGDAQFFGSTGSMHLNRPIVGMTATPSGQGYWLVASDGGVFAYGDAAFYGSTGNMQVNQPVVGVAATPTGHGYWLVASDGGLFAYGDAAFFGSTGGQQLNQPIVGMTPSPTGNGYWLVARDGGIFAYGDAQFHGSAGGAPLNKPIVGITPTASGNGYWLAASDGGVFAYGDGQFFGSMGGSPLNGPIIGVGGG